MTNRRFPIHSTSRFRRYTSALNLARSGEMRSPSIIECALFLWTACAVFLRQPSRCKSPMPPRFRQACRRLRRLAEQLCSFHSLSIGRILRTHKCRATTSNSTQVPISRPATFAPGLSPSRSDYMITRDLLAPGNYFWRVRALHGDVAGLWSAGRAITVTAPVAPPDVNLFAILAEPVDAFGGNTAHARVMLDNPAPAGGAVVSLSTDIPQVNMPATTVTVPAEEPMQRFPISPPVRCRTTASPLESLEIYLPASPMVVDRIRSAFFRFSSARV